MEMPAGNVLYWLVFCPLKIEHGSSSLSGLMLLKIKIYKDKEMLLLSTQRHRFMKFVSQDRCVQTKTLNVNYSAIVEY